MDSLPAESRIILAFKAIKDNLKLKLQRVAKIYSVSPTTLTARRDIPANS